MKGWKLVYEHFDPSAEGLREALCTLGNGYFATRGAAPESAADDVHYPGTYLAGGYNRLQTEIAGRVIENEDLVNLPNWLTLSFRIDGGSWFNLLAVDILSYRQELDLSKGVLTRSLRFRDRQGRATRLTDRRLVHMGYPHVAALQSILMAENWSGGLEICSALDGGVVNSGVDRYRSLKNKHLEPIAARQICDDSIFLAVRTSQSRVEIAQASRLQVFRNGSPAKIRRTSMKRPDYIAQHVILDVARDDEIVLEKVVTMFTSRDRAISECGLEAGNAVRRAGRFAELFDTHAVAWDHLWRRFDIEIEEVDSAGTGRIAMILRLHLFHLLQTTSPHTMGIDAGVPARGWHGEAYRGHIFWDELFIFPLMNLRLPEITRALLRYRFRRLRQARAAAADAGYHGAMYPWQSGSDGREESQQLHLNPKSGRWTPDNSRLQRHVGSAIAYNVWRYYEVTRDMQFLSSYGAEMLLEVARFWASVATWNPDQERFEILGVMGPDEYHDQYPDSEHPGLDNNAYTNLMAVWVICRALEVLEILPEDRRVELCRTLRLQPEEIDRWQQVSRRMRVVFLGDGLISQFEGYDRLEEFDWEGYRARYGNIQRLDRILEAEGDSTNRYQVSKQADLLMLFYLFSAEELADLFCRLDYPFDRETIPRNIDYYMQRTSHGSTLSRVVHSWVLARSDRIRSWELFKEALESDVADIQGGTTPEGIHLGAMAGTVELLQRGATGIVTRGDVLWFNPCLPEALKSLRLKIHYQGRLLALDIGRDRFRVSAVRSREDPVRIGFQDEVYILRGGETREFSLPAPGCPD